MVRGNHSIEVVGSADERQGTARYLQALAQHWPFILGSMALAVATAVAYLLVADRRYDAHADLLVTPVALNDNTFVGLPVMRESGEGRGVLTAARLVETPRVADSVRRQLRIQTRRDDLFESVRVEPQEQSSIVTITAEAGSAAGAAAIANAFATGVIGERTRIFQQKLRPLIQRLSRRLDAIPERSRDEGEGGALADRLATLRGLANAQDPTLSIASLAVAPAEAAWPRPVLSLAVAILVGLLLGMGVAIALELLNPLVLRDEDILEERIPLLARVPRVSIRDLRRHVVGKAAFGSDVLDAYQLARLNISAALPEGEEGTILVTSTTRGEGKTSAAVNLALVYAYLGRRVILVDADLRRSRLARVFDVPSDLNGLHKLLLGEASAEEVMTPVLGFEDRLSVVTSQAGNEYAFDLLQPQRVAALVEELGSLAEVVVFDSPPITDVADALQLATAVDAVVLVVRHGRTRRDKLSRARVLLGQLGIVPAGVVAVTRRNARLRDAPVATPDHVDARGDTPAATGKRRTRTHSSSRSS